MIFLEYFFELLTLSPFKYIIHILNIDILIPINTSKNKKLQEVAFL